MKKSILILLIALIPMLMIVSCSKDDDSESNFEMLVNYMDSNGMEIGDLLSSGWIVGADSTLHANMDNYYFMDMRADSVFATGHIPGAVNTSLGTLLEDADDVEKPIIMVCYTGQGAGHAVMALRLSGYMDARVLKWGMSGWNGDFDSWSGNVAQLDHANWKATPGEIMASANFDMPDLDTNGDTGAEILAERVDAMLAAGFKGIAGVDVLDRPGDYFVNNFWTAADVETYGNISGAYRINPIVLENLDPDAELVTYCWTGQTSSMITAYLNILGYNAKSLKFGANSMIYDALTVHKWGGSADWDYVTE